MDTNTLAYLTVRNDEKCFPKLPPRAHVAKFSGRNLLMFLLSQSVCPWQAFAVKPNV
jgi:hypothetical protein